MANYASLQSSIESAVDQYETYKSQSLRLKLENLSLGELSPVPSPTKSHAKRASLSIPGLSRLGSSDGKSTSRPLNPRTTSHDSNSSSPLQSPFNSTFTGADRRPSSPSIHASSPQKREFASFINVATDYETTNHILDLDFLLLVFDFMRIEHPYTSNSLAKEIKARNTAKKRLWNVYTSEMQGLARAYASGKQLPATGDTSPLGSPDKRRELKSRKGEVMDLVSVLQASERTCAESIVSASTHLFTQAIRDIHARYSMPDPINDKTTSVEKHNERARVFNELIKFVCDDLRNLERDTKSSTTSPSLATQKKKGSAGVVDAISSLSVSDYPPYGK